MKQCEYGHWYEETQFSVCPYCFVMWQNQQSYDMSGEAETSALTAEPQGEVYQMPQNTKKRFGKKHIVIMFSAGAALVIGVIIFLMIMNGIIFRDMKSRKGLDVAEGFDAYSKSGAGFSFLYQEGYMTEWSNGNGACVYCPDSSYILVCRAESFGRKSPEDYFIDVDEMMQESYDSVTSTEIEETEIDGRNIYRVRYNCVSGGEQLTVDRYLEPHRGFYMQYTAVSHSPDAANTELYYAIKTMCPNEDAYK